MHYSFFIEKKMLLLYNSLGEVIKLELRNPLFKSMDRDTYEGTEAVCTIHGTFGKTIMLLLVTIVAAIGSIALLNGVFGASDSTEAEQKIVPYIGLLFGSIIVALIAGLIATFSVRLCPVFSIIYAVAEGFMLGFITGLVDLAYPGIALIAVILTFVVTFIMGILYFTGIIKVGHKFRAFIFTALLSILIGSIVIAILAAVNVPGFRDILYNPSNPIGWLIDVLVAIIAALSLCVDFDYAAQLADREADKKYEWKAAFCLTTSIIYLYLRILNLLIRIAAASKK